MKKIPSPLGKIQKKFQVRCVDKRGLAKYDKHVLEIQHTTRVRRQSLQYGIVKEITK